MPLVSTRVVLENAMVHGYAVGAFNVAFLDMVAPIVKAAEEEQAPVILQMAPGQIDFMGINKIASVAKIAANEASVPVSIHLDHGKDFAQNVACLRAGFSSIMFDGSAQPYEDNVRMSRRIVEMAHAVGLGVEVELGRVGNSGDGMSSDDIRSLMTDPAEAETFIKEVDADFLAVAVGTVHSMIKRSAELDLERIAAIRDRVRRPLVLHGGSGVPHEVLAQAVANGICKINVSTELNKQYRNRLYETLSAKPDELNPRLFMADALAAVTGAVVEKIRLFGSAGKAQLF